MTEGPGADSGEKHEPASDIDNAVVGSLKALDSNRPIREADISRPPLRGQNKTSARVPVRRSAPINDAVPLGRRGVAICVMPVPPLVWRRLRVALRRVFPLLLAPERRHVEVAPGAPHRLIAAAIDKVGAENLVGVADECIVAVPFVHAEVGVEAIRDGVPRHLPTHSCLQALDVLLWRARGVRERGIAGVQMDEVGDLIGPERTAAAGMLGPAVDAGLEESAVDDHLTTAFK